MRSLFLLLAASGGLWLGGCASAVTFGEELNKATCERQYECAQGAFDMLYGDVGECRDALDEAQGAYFACQLVSCSFDASHANQCLHDVNTAACEHIVDGSAWVVCDEVFVDCDEDALADCLEE